MQACHPSFLMSLLCSLPCKMGGCQAAALPGIYYEKVYSKSIYLTAYLSNLFRVPFDDFSIPTIHEKIVFYK